MLFSSDVSQRILVSGERDLLVGGSWMWHEDLLFSSVPKYCKGLTPIIDRGWCFDGLAQFLQVSLRRLVHIKEVFPW